MILKFVYFVIVGLFVVWILVVIIYLNMGSYVWKVLVSGWLEFSYGVFKFYVDVRCGKVFDVLVSEG